MSFLDRFRSTQGTSTTTTSGGEVASKELTAVKEQQAKQTDEGTTALKATGLSLLPTMLLRAPHVSEKAARHASHGTYVFDVPVHAEKIAIKQAVEKLYQVHVHAVRTIRHEGKTVRRGRISGTRRAWKKALVTLRAGERIDIYEGV